MAILRGHLKYYREIFNFQEFWRDPIVMIGYQDISIPDRCPKDFAYGNLTELLSDKGLKLIDSMDLFDSRASIAIDLNNPVEKKLFNKYNVLIDIGSIEHVFDTKTCLENYFHMVKRGGLIVLITVVNGYFNHGLHVFNPEALRDSFLLNGFSILYWKYSTEAGIEVEDPSINENVLVWAVAKKIKVQKKFNNPQQGKWKDMYSWWHGQSFTSASPWWNTKSIQIGKIFRKVKGESNPN